MSYVTPFILFVLGVLVWRQQLSGKRRFEVAEQVLAAFYKASDGLSTLRSSIVTGGEIEAAKPKKDGEKQDDELPRSQSDEDQRRVRRAEERNVYVARADAISPVFGELRTAQILADIYFGRAAADPIDVLFRCRQQVFGAITVLYGNITEEFFATDELRQQHRQLTVSMNRLLAEHRADDTDELSQRIDGARAALERICRPALADAWWWPLRAR